MEASQLPELGTLLPVLLYKSSTRQYEPPPVGSWAKLRNVAAALLQGQLMVSRCLPFAQSSCSGQ